MAWTGKMAAARGRHSETDVPRVLERLDAIMALQMEFIELGERTANHRQLQLLWIFLQSGTIMVIKAYHLAMYMIRVLLHHEPAFLDVPTALLYYGYQIVSESLNAVLTIIAFSLLYQSFQQLLRYINKFNIYAADETLRVRLAQLSANLYTDLQTYTVFGMYPLNAKMLSPMLANMITFIVILVQYSLSDDYGAAGAGAATVAGAGEQQHQ